MFNSNQFNYKINPLNPSVITLEMTKRSKRNLLIKKLLPLAVLVTLVQVTAAVIARSEDLDLNDPEDTETPVKEK